MANDDRYSSAAGWDGLDKETRTELAQYQKRFEAYKVEHARYLNDDTALTVETPGDIFQTAAGADRRLSRQLFGDFFREGQLAILFADTGVGKSTLAVQIGDAIARGRDTFHGSPIVARDCRNEATPQKVVYIDFELTKDQFAARYSVGVRDGEYYGLHFFSHDKFLRARIDWDDDIPEGFIAMDDFIVHSIGKITEKHPDVKVLIIDNITYLTSSTTSMGESLRLMKGLKWFKDEYGLSILVIAHSPKRQQNGRLTVNDLQGSKMLANFADSIFAIGQCGHDPSVRYIKHIKIRTSEMKFHKDNVIACRIVKTRGFPHFAPFALTAEFEHILRVRNRSTDAITAQTKNSRVPSQPKPRQPNSSATKTVKKRSSVKQFANHATSLADKEANKEAEKQAAKEAANEAAKQLAALKLELKHLRHQGSSLRTLSRSFSLPMPDLRAFLDEQK